MYFEMKAHFYYILKKCSNKCTYILNIEKCTDDCDDAHTSFEQNKIDFLKIYNITIKIVWILMMEKVFYFCLLPSSLSLSLEKRK